MATFLPVCDGNSTVPCCPIDNHCLQGLYQWESPFSLCKSDNATDDGGFVCVKDCGEGYEVKGSACVLLTSAEQDDGPGPTVVALSCTVALLVVVIVVMAILYRRRFQKKSPGDGLSKEENGPYRKKNKYSKDPTRSDLPREVVGYALPRNEDPAIESSNVNVEVHNEKADKEGNEEDVDYANSVPMEEQADQEEEDNVDEEACYETADDEGNEEGVDYANSVPMEEQAEEEESIIDKLSKRNRRYIDGSLENIGRSSVHSIDDPDEDPANTKNQPEDQDCKSVDEVGVNPPGARVGKPPGARGGKPPGAQVGKSMGGKRQVAAKPTGAVGGKPQVAVKPQGAAGGKFPGSVSGKPQVAVKPQGAEGGKFPGAVGGAKPQGVAKPQGAAGGKPQGAEGGKPMSGRPQGAVGGKPMSGKPTGPAGGIFNDGETKSAKSGKLKPSQSKSGKTPMTKGGKSSTGQGGKSTQREPAWGKRESAEYVNARIKNIDDDAIYQNDDYQ